jgi:hypothetical protein
MTTRALSRLFFRLISASAIAMILGAACTIGTPITSHACPTGGTTLTYANFGEPFFNDWCVSCHGGPNAYSSRSFTSIDEIRADADRIFINAAADNSFMPPGPSAVTMHKPKNAHDRP